MPFWTEARSTKHLVGHSPPAQSIKTPLRYSADIPASRCLALCCSTSVPPGELTVLRTLPLQQLQQRLELGNGGFGTKKMNLLFDRLLVRDGSLGSNTYGDSLRLYACLCLALANITVTFSLPGAHGQFYNNNNNNKPREVFFIVTICLRHEKPSLIILTNAVAAAVKS